MASLIVDSPYVPISKFNYFAFHLIRYILQPLDVGLCGMYYGKRGENRLHLTGEGVLKRNSRS